MFPPENPEGNIEYKRHLCSEELTSTDDTFSIRFHQLITQLKYRLTEGNGIAVYYIGIEDDGDYFYLSKKEKILSLANLKKMVIYLDAKIKKVCFKEKYLKVVIKNKGIEFLLPEKRILLLGDTESGKTTFISYLVKDKVDTEKCKARLYVLKHKHEIETGKTSSFNYQYLIYDNIKYVFIDTPGDDVFFNKNIKTRNKIILSFKFDLIIFTEKPSCDWKKKLLYIYYANFFKIPHISINLFDSSSVINLVLPPSKVFIIDLLQANFAKEKLDETINEYPTNFNLLESYPHVDLGWTISGFLSSGKLKINQELYWYDNDKIEVIINSIYLNNEPINEILSPCTVTITLKKIHQINNKPRKGFLSNIDFLDIKLINLSWIYFNDISLTNEKDITIFVKNQQISLKKVSKSYKLVYPLNCYQLINQYFIYEKDEKYGFGRIFKVF